MKFSRNKLAARSLALGVSLLLIGSIAVDAGRGPLHLSEEDLLLERLAAERPDIIAFGSRSIFNRACLPLLRRIKEAFPDKPLVAGGYGPTFDPEIYLEEADYVVFGEGVGVEEQVETVSHAAPPWGWVRG